MSKQLPMGKHTSKEGLKLVKEAKEMEGPPLVGGLELMEELEMPAPMGGKISVTMPM